MSYNQVVADVATTARDPFPFILLYVINVHLAVCVCVTSPTPPLPQGVPTHDAEGKALSEKQRKKLYKLWQAQKEKYLRHQAATQS